MARAYVLMMLTALFWAGNAIAGRAVAGIITPAGLTFYRWLLASLAIFLVARHQIVRDAVTLRPHALRLFGLGALGLGAYNLAFYRALGSTTALNATIEQSALPVLVILANYVGFGERVSTLQLTGVGLTLVGVLCCATQGAPLRVLEVGVGEGDALVLLSVALYSGYTVALRARPAVHPLSLLFAFTVSACLFSAPFHAVDLLREGLRMPTSQAWLAIAYTALFPSLLSQLFYIRGVAALGANRAGLFINLVPVFGALLAVGLLGESFRPYHAIGLLLVLTGIAVAEHARPLEEAKVA